mmetsp:Transcript_20729/g.31192  ORF Transcript_20729/g.31192 Transcript_20729/m.31192 type:complete len:211 (-) Transcript_20729:1078-1710(-)
MNIISSFQGVSIVNAPSSIFDIGLSQQQLTMSSHTDIVIATSLFGGRLIGWITTGSTTFAQIGIAFSHGGKATATFGRTLASTGAASKEIARPSFPGTMFGTKNGILHTPTILFGTGSFVFARLKERMNFRCFDTFQPGGIVIVHGFVFATTLATVVSTWFGLKHLNVFVLQNLEFGIGKLIVLGLTMRGYHLVRRSQGGGNFGNVALKD